MTFKLLRTSVRLGPEASRTHIVHPFTVPAGLSSLHFLFSYNPKFIDDEIGRAAFLSNLDGYIDDAEERKATALRWNEIGPAYNLLTLSVDDAQGRFRGCVHRGNKSQDLVIGVALASGGLEYGPIPAGTWRITINVFAVYEPSCRYELAVTGTDEDD